VILTGGGQTQLRGTETMNAHNDSTTFLNPPATADSSARAVLRARIAARAAASEALATTGTRADRARANADAARVSLAVLGDVEGAIRQHQAEAYVAAAAGDLAVPTLDIPPALAERREQSRARAEALAAAELAEQSLAAERAAAIEVQKNADAAVNDAARAAMAEHAEDVASRLEEVMARAYILADELEAISMLSVPSRDQTWAEGRIRLSPVAMRRATTPLGHDGRPGLPAPQSYAGRRLPSLQTFFEALCRDADAARSEI
jgi:hypothetical protein